MAKKTLKFGQNLALSMLLGISLDPAQAGTDERLQALRSLDAALEASVEENEPQNGSNQNSGSEQLFAESDPEKSSLVQACDRKAVFSWHPDVRAGRINTSGIKFADIDTAAAIKVCRTASERFPDHARTFSNLGRALAAAGDFAGSLNALRRAAEMKDLYAYFAIGYSYEYGEGVRKSHTKAVQWYRKAANSGLAVGQFNLGDMYQDGKGVVQNKTQALKWYLKAAEQGHTVAQYKLGLMYARGEGIDENSHASRPDCNARFWTARNR